MNEHIPNRHDDVAAAAIDFGRRNLLKLTGAGLAAASMTSFAGAPAFAQEGVAWDKVFPQSDAVRHEKVRFPNRFGISLSADLYWPRNLVTSQRHPALIVAHPFGGVKEQSAGLYAQTMAERGYVALAFDVSYNGESGGEPRQIAAAETWVEDFSASVDYLGQQSFVDRARIGVIGICGGGGFGLAAAAIDPRIRAVATSVMYDIGQGNRQGLSETFDLAAFQQRLADTASQRWAEVDGAERLLGGAMPATLPEDADPILSEFFAYYGTPLGYHPRATRGFDMPSGAWMAQFWSFDKLPWISPRPVLFIAGEQAHSRFFSEQAYTTQPILGSFTLFRGLAMSISITGSISSPSIGWPSSLASISRPEHAGPARERGPMPAKSAERRNAACGNQCWALPLSPWDCLELPWHRNRFELRQTGAR